MTEYKCPYCGQDSYSKNSKKQGKFLEWKTVAGHVSLCNKNIGEYFIDKVEGPIHYTKFLYKDIVIRNIYPRLQSGLTDIRKSFERRGINIPHADSYWSLDSIIFYIHKFVKEKKRIPQIRDFENNIEYPSRSTVAKYFGTWNNAIQTAGFTPNFNYGFGNRITALDGIIYRSWYETEFVNKWLFNKEKYLYEVKYPNSLKRYDFYLPEKNLYIEIDGGLRPQVMEEKIAINKQLGRKLLVIKTSEIQNFKGF